MRRPSPFYVIAFVALFIVAIVMRVTGIGKESMWFDEVASVRITGSDVAHTMSSTAKDSTPFGYFIGLHGWNKVTPQGDGWKRGYSALWSMTGVCLLTAFTGWLLGYQHALIVLLFAAVSPLDIYYAQELRMYSQGNAFGILSSWLLLIWMDARGRSRLVLAAAGYALAAAALLQTHYVCLMLLLAQGTFVIVYYLRSRSWRRIGGYAGMTVLTVILFLPWFFYVRHVNGGISAKNASWITLPPMHYYISFIAQEFFWGRAWLVYSQWWPLSLGLVAISTALIIKRLRRGGEAIHRSFRDSSIATYLACLVFLPVLYVAVISRLFQPVYDRQRFALFVLPPFLVLLAFACMEIRMIPVRIASAGIIASVMFAGSVFQYRQVHKPDFRAVRRLFEEKGPPYRLAALPLLYRLPMGHVLGKKPPYLTLHESADTNLLPDGANVWILDSNGNDPVAMKLKNHLHGLGTTETLLVANELIVTSVTIQRSR